jgi:hypothetical protein
MTAAIAAMHNMQLQSGESVTAWFLRRDLALVNAREEIAECRTQLAELSTPWRRNACDHCGAYLLQREGLSFCCSGEFFF